MNNKKLELLRLKAFKLLVKRLTGRDFNYPKLTEELKNKYIKLIHKELMEDLKNGVNH